MKLPTMHPYYCRALRISCLCYGVRGVFSALLEQRVPHGAALATIELCAVMVSFAAYIKLLHAADWASVFLPNGTPTRGDTLVFISVAMLSLPAESAILSALSHWHIPEPVGRMIAPGTTYIASYLFEKDDDRKPPKKRRAWFLLPSQVQS